MKKIIITLFLLCAPFFVKAEDAITIDGDFSDWDNIISGVTDSQDVTGTWQYYVSSGVWQTTCPNIDPEDSNCDSLMVNQEKELDIVNFKITNSSDYIYLYFYTAEPLGAIKNGSNSVYTSRDAFGVPSAFNHWLVVGIDTSDDDEADYFYVFNIAWDSSSNGFPDTDMPAYLYQDKNSDGKFTLDSAGNPDETLLSQSTLLDWHLETVNYEPKLEMKLDLNDFLSASGLAASQDINIKVVTDSDIAESTDDFTYNFTSGNSSINVPNNLHTSSLQSTSVNLVWDALSGAAQYQIQLRLDSDALVKNYYVTSTTQKVDKTILLSNNKYKFRLRAEINGTWEDWTNYYSFQTLPAKPTSVTVSKKEADQLLLQWTKPRGDITKYQVNVYSAKNKLIESYSTTAEKKAIKNLLPQTKYIIKVKAFNNDVGSNWSKIKKPTTNSISYYLKIFDVTTTNLNVSTPGADMDAILITTQGGSQYYAAQVVASQILDGGLGYNRHNDVNSLVGEADHQYCSLGGYGAYAILKYDAPVNYNVRSLTSYELGSTSNGVDEPIRIYAGPTQDGPWTLLGEGGGEYKINL